MSIRLNHQIAADEIASQGYTITEVAAAMGMERANLSHCLAGRRHFPPEKIPTLAAFLKVKPYKLLGPEDARESIIELARLHGVTGDDIEAVS